MEDITLRAIQILNEVNLILAEDTRKTGLFLQHLGIKKSLLSYFEQNELERTPEVVEKLKSGQNMALVSNAGTPTISDPGFKLVRECIKEGIQVVSIPGSSAILAALTSSGLPTDKFLFLGFLPKKPSKRKKLLEDLFHCFKTLIQIHPTIIFFESPYRVINSLIDLKEIFGDIEIVICRELTKLHEEIRRGKVNEAIDYFSKVKPKGEFTLVFRI